jgi:TniQ
VPSRSHTSWSSESQDRLVRTLPIRLDPLPEESLDSWLEALARRTATAWGDTLSAVGLTDPIGKRSNDPRRRPCWLGLTARQINRLGQATGIAPALAHSMTLTSLMPVPDGAQFPHSTRLPGSRFCPACLAERDGRWRLWWRLRWAFACPTHGCLLVEECPACQRSQRVRPHPSDLVPNPGSCTRSSPAGGRKPDRCLARLASADVLHLGADHPAAAHQRHVLAILATGSAYEGIYVDSAVSGEVFMRDLTALGQRILRYAEPAELRARLPDDLWQEIARVAGQRTLRADATPACAITSHSSPSIAASAACLAMPILFSDSRVRAGERLHWLVASMRRRRLTVSASNVGWGRNVSDAFIGVQLSSLAPFLGPIQHLRHRGCSTRPPVGVSTSVLQHSLPALLWPQWAVQFTTTGVGFGQLRSALSVATVLVGSRISVSSACASLGAVTHTQAVSRVLQKLYAWPDWDEFAETLISLSDTLTSTAAPIDYGRRRELDCGDLLPDSQWQDICHDLAAPTGRLIKARLHRCWLYERITGSPARSGPHAIDDPRFFAALADLPRTLSPELVTALEDVGRDYLLRHGIGDEPLMWFPERDVTIGSGASGFELAAAHVDEIHHLVAAEGLSLGAIARRTGTTLEIIREVLSCHPAPRQILEGALRAVGGRTAQARRALSRDRFQDLYVQQRLSLADIAAEVGVSRQTVTRLAHYYGIEIRAALRPRGH